MVPTLLHGLVNQTPVQLLAEYGTYPAPWPGEPDSGTASVGLAGPGFLRFALVSAGAGTDHLSPLDSLATLH